MSLALEGRHLRGVGAALVGGLVYLYWKRARRKARTTRSTVALGIAMALVGLAIVSSISGDALCLAAALHSGPAVKMAEEVDEGHVAVKAQNERKTEYVVQLIEEYSERRNDKVYKNYDEAVQHDFGNVGNLVWQYGAFVALPDFSGVTLCHSANTTLCAALARKEGKKLVLYRPMANNLSPNMRGHFSMLIDSLYGALDEILVVGVGVQVPFRNVTSEPAFVPGAAITYTVKDYPVPTKTREFLALLRAGGGEMLMRGSFARDLVQRTGFPGARVTGCPSFWINREGGLGTLLAEKYAALAARVGDRSLRVAVNVKNVHGFEHHIVYLREAYPRARFYAQGKGDIRMLRHLGVPFESVRFFNNVEDWLADMAEMDVSYGIRIHGNMLALAAGVPPLIVASDWRVLELAWAMRLPVVTTYDDAFRGEGGEVEVDMGRLVRRAAGSFDAQEFDRNRCQLARVFREAFARYGFGVAPHVASAARQCA